MNFTEANEANQEFHFHYPFTIPTNFVSFVGFCEMSFASFRTNQIKRQPLPHAARCHK
jgi:hypothetical protein